MTSRFLIIYIFLFPTLVLAENSIIAIVDQDIITTNELNRFFNKSPTKAEKLQTINLLIDSKIEGKKFKDLKIIPNNKLINIELTKIAKKNNISLDDIIKASNFQQLLSNIKYQISKNSLIDLVYQDSLNEGSEISDKVKIYEEWFKKLKANTFIEIYEEKL